MVVTQKRLYVMFICTLSGLVDKHVRLLLQFTVAATALEFRDPNRNVLFVFKHDCFLPLTYGIH
jgi:hypothetical protein